MNYTLSTSTYYYIVDIQVVEVEPRTRRVLYYPLYFHFRTTILHFLPFSPFASFFPRLSSSSLSFSLSLSFYTIFSSPCLLLNSTIYQTVRTFKCKSKSRVSIFYSVRLSFLRRPSKTLNVVLLPPFAVFLRVLPRYNTLLFLSAVVPCYFSLSPVGYTGEPTLLSRKNCETTSLRRYSRVHSRESVFNVSSPLPRLFGRCWRLFTNSVRRK